MSKVLVIGSYNVGLTVMGDKIPKTGETVLGNHFDMGPGGKGSNQAIAVSRLGGDVIFLAKIGGDIFGDEALKLFKREGINTDYIKVDPSTHTGAGIIFVDKDGHNAIGVAPGANYRLSIDELEAASDLFNTCGFLLVQLEIPLPVVYHAIKKAKQAGATVVLNPAPAQKIDLQYLSMVDILTPNETETEILTGRPVTDLQSATDAARQLISQGVKTVILTLGEQGCILVSDEKQKHFSTPQVKAIDTTGAGDAFNGALVYALAAGKNMEEAIDFACKAGAFSVTSIGVVPGLPTMKNLKETFEGL